MPGRRQSLRGEVGPGRLQGVNTPASQGWGWTGRGMCSVGRVSKVLSGWWRGLAMCLEGNSRGLCLKK